MNTVFDDLRGVPRAWGLEVALEAIVGLSAVSGGLTLALAPDGSAAHTPLSLLEGGPFHSYLVPGLLLAVVIGGGNLLAAALTLQHSRFAAPASLVAGGGLMVFIISEALLLPVHHPLQVVFFVLGAAILLLSIPKRER